MPRLDGIQLCKELKVNPRTKSVPVVIHSSFDSELDVEKGFQAGASAYISKNESLDTLVNTTKELIFKTTQNRDRLIMVVDDSGVIRKIVEDGLVRAGFNVITAENGKAASELIKRQKPDLILSDIDMPVMNGFDFCKLMHSEPEFSSIPFAAMSSKSDRGAMQRMLDYGAESYISKPFNVDQLVLHVEKLLSDHYRLIIHEKEQLEKEKKLILASITGLVAALEARDPYTKGHSEGVANIVTGMAEFMGKGKEEVQKLTIGGRLHDIGKIGVKDSVLLKPGKLTDEEFAHIKEHPVTGANILKGIESLSDIISIVLYHHERYDGKGYPDGLKGMKIPLWARMVAVADTYNSLRTDRPYRKGMSREKAFQIIKDVRGTQLCPECVDLFLDWYA
jgi:response regulator RpfG family c-di-GMP phosphodiesterase